MLEQFDHIERVFVYDQFSEACARFVDRWQQQRPEINFIATENAKEAVSNGEDDHYMYRNGSTIH